MPANSIVRARVDETLKQEAAAVPATMGLTVADFVRIDLTRAVNEQKLSFEMKAPNRLTTDLPAAGRNPGRDQARQRHGEDQEADAPADRRKTPAAGAAANPPCRLESSRQTP